MTRLRAVLLVALLLPLLSQAAAAAHPAPGSPAPALAGPGVVLDAPCKGDITTSGPLVLLFLKPGDMHSARAAQDLVELMGRHERFGDGVRYVAVACRVQPGAVVEAPGLPKGSCLLRDHEDTLYKAYGIIATPTVVVIDREGLVAGFHPGYSSSLAHSVQQDLLKVMDGPRLAEAPTPTPGNMKLQMGRALARRGLWDKALAYYRESAEVEQPAPDVLLEMAVLHLELGQFDEATTLAREAEAALPGDPRVETLLRRVNSRKSGEQQPPKPPPVP